MKKLISILFTLIFFNGSLVWASSRNDYTEYRHIAITQNKNKICMIINDDTVPFSNKGFLEKIIPYFSKKGIPIKLVSINNVAKPDVNYIFYARSSEFYKIYYRNECIDVNQKLKDYIYNYNPEKVLKEMDGKYNVEIASAWHSKLKFKGEFCMSKGKIVVCN